ncbi:hypothetical protein RHSIM_Rhsim07G0240100 [Rhododendron simsii]|uniref:Galactose oxidase/kelch repeat superfamily protein n=1 Tax=Rhododendron simsii TaxID=118357 RepID=A0A834LJ88_RHOSS|nr:hypothetical protein RHSIM_Rhsim07G0240100 [Rhododendron simsii]
MESIGGEFSTTFPDARPPLPPEKKFACMLVLNRSTRNLEWYAFDVSEDPNHNQRRPPSPPPRVKKIIGTYMKHLLPFHDDNDESVDIIMNSTPVATRRRDSELGWAILGGKDAKPTLYRIRCGSVGGVEVRNSLERIGLFSDGGWDSNFVAAPPNGVSLPLSLSGCLVLGEKLYFMPCSSRSQAWGMAYDPNLNEWESVIDPPHLWRPPYFVAAMGDGSPEPRIVVGSSQKRLLQFYFVRTNIWDEIEFDGAPKGLNEAPVAVDNRLYWYVQDDDCLVGYDIVTKMWFLGSLHLHDHSDYVDPMKPLSHFPVRLAHLGGRGDQVFFCLFWVSRFLPRTRTMVPAKLEDLLTRLHCMKFQVSINSNLSTNQGNVPLDVSIHSCQSYLVPGARTFMDALVL